jgi:hypothetical protein
MEAARAVPRKPGRPRKRFPPSDPAPGLWGELFVAEAALKEAQFFIRRIRRRLDAAERATVVSVGADTSKGS